MATSEAVRSLMGTIFLFDPIMAEHLTATAVLAERVATKMGLDEATIENCRIGALLHDIGLLGIDKTILDYPGMLVSAEWNAVEQHPVLGATLLSTIPSLAHLAHIVRAHHERIDGSGYPDALIGTEIPLETRIITVVDAFHAMTIPHLYRDAADTMSALSELIGNSKSQFDEHVVEATGATLGYRRRLRLSRSTGGPRSTT